MHLDFVAVSSFAFLAGYLGCFPVIGDGDHTYRNENMTTAFCVEHCRGSGEQYVYAAAMNDTCTCASSTSYSSVFNMRQRRRMADCDTPCSGNEMQLCGKGATHRSVHIIGRSEHKFKLSGPRVQTFCVEKKATHIWTPFNTDLTCKYDAFLFRNKENKILFGPPPPKRRKDTNGRKHGYTHIVLCLFIPAACDLYFY